MADQLEELEEVMPETEPLPDGEDVPDGEDEVDEEPLPDDSENSDSSADGESNPPTAPSVDGVLVSEVAARLSHNLYQQLSDGSEEFVCHAMRRAKVELEAVLSWIGVSIDLDVPVQREAFLHLTVYQLHLALGHEDEGAEYRAMAKSLIANAYGNYPADTPATAPSSGVVLGNPSPRHGQLSRARRF